MNTRRAMLFGFAAIALLVALVSTNRISTTKEGMTLTIWRHDLKECATAQAMLADVADRRIQNDNNDSNKEWNPHWTQAEYDVLAWRNSACLDLKIEF